MVGLFKIENKMNYSSKVKRGYFIHEAAGGGGGAVVNHDDSGV
jgi:hypothetical protein